MKDRRDREANSSKALELEPTQHQMTAGSVLTSSRSALLCSAPLRSAHLQSWIANALESAAQVPSRSTGAGSVCCRGRCADDSTLRPTKEPQSGVVAKREILPCQSSAARKTTVGTHHSTRTSLPPSCSSRSFPRRSPDRSILASPHSRHVLQRAVCE